MTKKNIFLTKFTVVAVMAGFLSPSVSLKNVDNQTVINVSVLQKAEARRPARARPARRPAGNRNINRNINRGGNANRNINRNVNRNVNRNYNRNVNVNVNHYGGGYHGGYHHGGYGHYHGHPILAFTTAVAIGSIIASATMPKTCTTVVANGISYRRCDNSYFQPFYQGDTLVYKAVPSPY